MTAQEIAMVVDTGFDDALEVYYATHPQAVAQATAGQAGISLTPSGVQAQIGTNTVILLAIVVIGAVFIFSK